MRSENHLEKNTIIKIETSNKQSQITACKQNIHKVKKNSGRVFALLLVLACQKHFSNLTQQIMKMYGEILEKQPEEFENRLYVKK